MGLLARILEALYGLIIKDGILMALLRINNLINFIFITPIVKIKNFFIGQVNRLGNYKMERTGKKINEIKLKKLYQDILDKGYDKNKVILDIKERHIVLITETKLTVRFQFEDEWTIDYIHPHHSFHNHIQVYQEDFILNLLDGNIALLFSKNLKSRLLNKNVSFIHNIQNEYNDSFIKRKSALLSFNKVYFDNIEV